jgi:hypothetical protein
MNLFSLVITGLFVLLTLAFAVMLFSAIVFNLKIGRRYRRSLAREIDRLRLGRMLGALGIDIDAYLHSEQVRDIQAQMSRCAQCANTADCDETLARGKVDSGEIDFCNNEEALKDVAAKQRRQPVSES